MNRKELVAAVTETPRCPAAKSRPPWPAVLEHIVAATAAGNKVTLPGFGTFAARERPARDGRNPATGAPLQIAATRSVAFKPGTTYKQHLADTAPTSTAAKSKPETAPAAKKAAPAVKKTTKSTTKRAPAKK